MTSRWKSGLAALVAVGSVLGASAVSDVANALPAGTPPENGGGLTLSPSSGTFATPFQIQFDPANQLCPGDNTTGWVYTPFITQEPDVAPLTFSTAGSPQTISGEFTNFFRDSGGNIRRNIFPSLNNFLVTSVSNLSFGQTFTPDLAPGEYTVGVACQNPTGPYVDPVNGTIPARENAKYWTTEITVFGNDGDPATPEWTEGVVPVGPVLDENETYDSGTQTATVNFTHAASNPATTGYTATVTPVGGAAAIAPISVAAGATSFDIPGVVLGSQYTVTLVATNDTGDSAASASITVDGAVNSSGLNVVAPDVFEGNDADITWTGPTDPASPTPTSFTLEISDGVSTVLTDAAAISPYTADTSPLPSGDYTVTVTPVYAAGSGVNGVPASVNFRISANTLIYQEIEVTRPAGNLVLTQRCGVYGELPAYGATADFPKALALAAAVGGLGNAPVIRDGSVNDGSADPLFGQYPYPVDVDGNSIANYPTECGVDMGTAELVTDDTNGGAGEFFLAHGRLNQVTVVDTRDDDLGWTATGDVEDFSVAGGDTFSGDYLGWTPVMTDDSDTIAILPAGTYDQVVTAGTEVAPGTSLGLTNDATLASAPAAAGLGIATLDARLLLKIPVQYDADTYNATLSISVVTL